MRKLFGYILSPIHYILFGLTLVIFQPLQWFCYNVFGYKAHKWSVDWLNFFLVSTYYSLGNTVRFTNKQNLPIGRPIIFIANHQSMYDIPVLIWFLRKYHAKFISKIELTKGIPSISYNLKYGGAANIDRKDPRQSIAEIAKLGTRMKEKNWSAVIFPEGTRSKDGNVKSFQAGGVAVLLKKCPEALIVPIAINNAWKMLRYGAFPLNTFLSMTWEVLSPIERGELSVEDVVKTAEESIRAKITGVTYPELKLHKHILEKAVKSGNEYGWKKADVLDAIETARQVPMAIIGGQVQYVWPDATCELYWLSYDSDKRKDNEDWVTYCNRTAFECSEKVKKLMTTDMEKEAIKTFEYIKSKVDSGISVNDNQIFILYFTNQETVI